MHVITISQKRGHAFGGVDLYEGFKGGKGMEKC